MVFLSSLTIVFSNRLYLALAAAVFSAFWIIFNVSAELLFFFPVFVFYLPQDAILVFVLSNVISVLMGIIVSMNIYIIKHFSMKLSKSMFSGSFVGTVCGACVSCSSVGFIILTTFGSFGAVLSTFLSVYQIPLLVGSIGILTWSYYSIHKKLTSSCVLKNS